MCHEVELEFFATNAPYPPLMTPNSCFGAFHTIWVHLGPFGCLTKLGAKPAELVQKFVLRNTVHLRPFGCLTKHGAKCFELVQKFVPRRRVGFFRYKRTRSTPLDPKHMFWIVSYHLHAFGIIRLPYKTRVKTLRISAKVRATRSLRSF